MNPHIDEILRRLLSNITVLNAELTRLHRNEQLDSVSAAKLMKDIREAYTAGMQLLRDAGMR